MAQIAADIRIDPLRTTLIELGEQRRLILWLARLVRAAWVWCAALLGVLLFDAALPLSPEARIVGDLLLLLGIPVGLLLTRTRPPDAHRGPLRDARQLEDHHELAHNPLVNGLLLAPLKRSTGDVLVRTLAGRTHERAADVVRRVDRQVVVDRWALRREFFHGGLVAAAWLTTLIAAPSLLGTGLARMLMPYAPHPPFSFTTIELAADPREPFVGEDVDLIATLTGVAAQRGELVELDEDFSALRRWPMREAGTLFVRTLRSVREPMLVQAEANGARSKRLRLEPKQRPPEQSPDDPGIKDAAEDRPEQRQPRMMQPQQPNDTFDLAREFPEIHEKVQQLQARAQKIGQMLQQLQAMDPQSAEFRQRLDQIEAELAKFRHSAGEAAAMCRAAAQDRGTTPTQRQMLESLANALESLGMCKLGNCPPGMTPAMGMGVRGAGGSGLFGSPMGNWMTGLENAQFNDLAFITQMLREMGVAASPFGDAGPRNVHATAMPGPPDPAVGGDYAETYDLADDEGVVPDRAVMQRVPPMYRQLVRRYYERLAEDERSRP